MALHKFLMSENNNNLQYCPPNLTDQEGPNGYIPGEQLAPKYIAKTQHEKIHEETFCPAKRLVDKNIHTSEQLGCRQK